MKLIKPIKDIISEIKKNGYCILDNCYTNRDLDEMKSSLLYSLNYINPDNETDLQKKYYKIRDFDRKLKGNWYDIAGRDINLLKHLHSPELINITKEYFNTKVVYSGRPCIGVYDDENVHLLEPHQETNQLAADNLLFWAPLYDTNKENGGLTVYKGSHKEGYFEHTLTPKNKKVWTKDYTHVDPSISKRFESINLEVKAGSAVLLISSCLHTGYPNKVKNSVRITVCERFNPLQRLPYLKDKNASMKIPYTGIDYNKIKD